jgi:GTP-sensing pleiotropic transcriptional regulator CodY
VNSNELNYEEILVKLKKENITNNFRLMQCLQKIITNISYHETRNVIKILAELDKDIKKISMISIADELVGVQPMSDRIGSIFNFKFKDQS